MLNELNDFASRGIPEIICRPSILNADQIDEDLFNEEKQRDQQFIDELKLKLDELEHYAAAAGSLDGAPTSVIIEKQKVLIDQLRTKLDLQLDDSAVSKLSFVETFFYSTKFHEKRCFFSGEELKKLVDQAIHQVRSTFSLRSNKTHPFIISVNECNITDHRSV